MLVWVICYTLLMIATLGLYLFGALGEWHVGVQLGSFLFYTPIVLCLLAFLRLLWQCILYYRASQKRGREALLRRLQRTLDHRAVTQN